MEIKNDQVQLKIDATSGEIISWVYMKSEITNGKIALKAQSDYQLLNSST